LKFHTLIEYISNNIHIFFSNFFEAEKHSFQIFEKNELHRGRALKRVSGKDSMISIVCKTRDENSKKMKYYKYIFHAYFSIFYVSTLSFAKTDIFVACVEKGKKKGFTQSHFFTLNFVFFYIQHRKLWFFINHFVST
jgi:hypothetical protein